MLRSRLFAIFLVASLLFEPVALLLVLLVLVELVALFQTSSSYGATLERKDAVEHEDGGCGRDCSSGGGDGKDGD
jgi:hypothetical protein